MITQVVDMNMQANFVQVQVLGKPSKKVSSKKDGDKENAVPEYVTFASQSIVA